MLHIANLFQTACDPDLDIGVTVNKKSKETKNSSRLQAGKSSAEPTLAPPDLKAMTNSSDWVSLLC